MHLNFSLLGLILNVILVRHFGSFWVRDAWNPGSAAVCECTFEMHLSIMLPLPSHNLECVLIVLEYASSVWGGIPKYLVEYLQRVKYRAFHESAL